MAANVDGAILVDRLGKIIDVGCMIRHADSVVLREEGIEDAPTFAGARTTAAWNASFYGLAIKVSEDGPISIFRRGKQLVRIGES